MEADFEVLIKNDKQKFVGSEIVAALSLFEALYTNFSCIACTHASIQNAEW